MEYIEITEVGRVSRVGLGTWQFGSREWGYGDSYAEGTAQAFAVLRMEPFERPLELQRLCTQVTEIWCRAVYIDPDRSQRPDAGKLQPATAGGRRRR